MALRDQPYIPFYVDDYLSDEKVKQCDPSSEGIYIRVLCNMHKSKSYGQIEITPFDQAKLKQTASKIVVTDEEKSLLSYVGIAVSDFSIMVAKISNLIGRSNEQVFRALLDLLGNDVLQMDGLVLLQKRMVRDGQKSEARAKAGRIGGSNKVSKTEARPKQNPVNVIVNEYVIDNDNRDLGKEMQEENPLSDWRNSFQTYLSELERALDDLKNDHDFQAKQQKYYPSINIPLSLEKACTNYWATKQGWEQKKKSKSVSIDWKATLRNALTMESNQVKISGSYHTKTVF